MKSRNWFGGAALAGALVIGLAPLAAVAQPAQRAPMQAAQALQRPATVADFDADIDLIPLAEIDIQGLRAAELVERSNGAPPQFATATDVAISPATAGVLEEHADGTMTWRLRLEAANAMNVNLGMLYRVPGSTRLDIADGAGALPFRTYTGGDVYEHGEFWTPVVKGNVIELHASFLAEEWPAFRDGLMIFSANLGYRDFFNMELDAQFDVREGDDRVSAPCHVDVVCPEGDPYGPQIQGVCRVVIGGTGLCSAGLLNNTNENGDPLFMCAHHCGAWASPGSLVLNWNYENSFCRNNVGGFGDGSLADVTTGGGTLIATDPLSDWTLIRLNNQPLPQYNATYLGWDNGGTSPTSTVGVHHPRGTEKRISIDLGGAVPALVSITGQSNIRSWRVTFDEGVIEQGSSGSPLFNQDGRVVGTATAVNTLDPCNVTQTTWYGRLNEFWSNEPAAVAALDPAGTGQQTLDFFGFTPGPPLAFLLNSPGDGATGVGVGVNLIWIGSLGADDYFVEVSDNPTFTGPNVFEDTVFAPTTTAAVLPGTLDFATTYYWRVTANNTFGSIGSTPFPASFTTVSPPVPGAPTLVSPNNGETGTDLGPVFDWDPGSNASEYRLEVDTSPAFDTGNLITEIIAGPATEYDMADSTLPANTQHFWRVTSINVSGEAVSSLRTFTTGAPPPSCIGDLDGDGDTLLSDFAILAANFGRTDLPPNTGGDFTGDGAALLEDFAIFAADFGCES